MKVVATQPGVYNHRMYEKGEVFDVDKDFFADSESVHPATGKKHGWMKEVDTSPKKSKIK